MTYKETLDWMFAQLPMYQQKGKIAFNGKLDNILSFDAYLNQPHKKFKSIHVAGTNGKGSCSHMLASILQEAGYKVGLYTSPHLKDFRERIKINGKPVPKKYVVDFIANHKSFFDKYKLSFFEMTVGMAYDFFARQQVDIAIIEVGLGGRLDSTNIITPEVSLITNIGYDHVDMLGDTLEKIAYEKAGIIKKGVPVVIGETQEEIVHLFKSIAEKNESDIVFADKKIKENFETSLLGTYQKKNVRGVVATLKMLKSFETTESQINTGLLNVVENTGLLGRWQILQRQPIVMCDTAHNTEGLQLVLYQIQQQKFDRLHIVLGFVKDKNLDVILPLFPKNARYYLAKPNIPRGLEVEVLSERALQQGLNSNTYQSVKMALKSALENANPSDFIYVGGSTFVVAEVV